jgi:hypothetical protein
VLFVVFLAGCADIGPERPLPRSVADPRPREVPPGMPAAPAPGPPPAPAALPAPRAAHVVVIGCDGMSPDGVKKAKTPVMTRLMRSGAYTLHARGVMPTESSPNWASMIMGAGPEQHGVTSNSWKPYHFDIPPVAYGPGGIFPTVFSALRTQRPRAVIGVFHDWDDFARLVERGVPDVIEHWKGPQPTVEHAVAFLKARRPDFLFIHLDNVDHAGHEKGHGTPEYYQAVEEADRLIGVVLDALEAEGMLERTVVLVTADHGGKAKGHGGATLGEIEIPWIMAGPGIAVGKELQSPVNTFDTAPTIAAVLGIRPPDAWIGRAVREAFAETR